MQQPDPIPLLQPHYRAFIALTDRPAPVLRIGTLASWLVPLVLLPLDPGNKYLRHSFVESPDGIAATDDPRVKVQQAEVLLKQQGRVMQARQLLNEAIVTYERRDDRAGLAGAMRSASIRSSGS